MSRLFGTGISSPEIHIVPDSIELISGTIIGGGTVADIQNWQDGNILEIQELAATPALDIILKFANVDLFRRISLGISYAGSATHYLTAELLNFAVPELSLLWTIENGHDFSYLYADIPVRSDDYIDAGKNAHLRICHPTSGNVSHSAFIDYGALIR